MVTYINPQLELSNSPGPTAPLKHIRPAHPPAHPHSQHVLPLLRHLRLHRCLSVLATATPNYEAKRWSTSSTAEATTTVTVTATAPASTESAGSCNVGDLQCCNSVESASSPAATTLLGLLGIVVDGLDVLLGLGCSPISVIGVGSGSACDASPVCCENNNVGGLISIGCVPVIL
ncbi:Fruiting body protein SC3 [Grifola frondosa]|uniref:Hydrophobin n=1 Tax=Grifola frondosa TaxID=5627 RepID=A0A1C7MM88_GRIFR|nr:Fruiting body protein SC3 [Grifola frondosa]